jgi:hypothetical protein
MKKLFQKSKLKNLYFGGFLFIIAAAFIVSCAKNDDVTMNPDFTTQKQTAQQLQGLTTLPLSITGLNAGTTEDVLAKIEEALNEEYGVPEQSIGAVQYDENEFIISAPNGYLNQDEASDIYIAAVNHWADTYDSFDAADKDALSIDVSSEAMENGDTKVIIGTWVGEIAEEAEMAGCNAANFPEGQYLWSVGKKEGNPTITKYADTEMMTKFNKKPLKDYCKTFSETKKIHFDIPAGTQILNKSELDAAYCAILALINAELAKPGNAGASFGFINLRGDIVSTSPRFVGDFYIGVKKQKVPCFGTRPEKPGKIGEDE